MRRVKGRDLERQVEGLGFKWGLVTGGDSAEDQAFRIQDFGFSFELCTAMAGFLV